MCGWLFVCVYFFFSSRRRHTSCGRDWSSDVCSSDLVARRRPDAPALVWDGGALTWQTLERRAGGVARQLSGRGVAAGDTIALVLHNGWVFVAALWGGLKLGATIAPLNPLLAAGERDRMLDHLRPALVLEDVPEDEARGQTGDAV